MTFEYKRDAIRVKVKKNGGINQSELRKFSVDPQITTFEVLQSILSKAFDIKGDFTTYYRNFDDNGQEVYLPLLSDWDLDVAFLRVHNLSLENGHEPCLYLQIEQKHSKSSQFIEKANAGASGADIAEIKTIPRLHGIFNQMEKTFNLVSKAFNFGEDGTVALQTQRKPLSDAEFRTFLDPVGQIIYAKELRTAIYYGGIEPSLRRVVWKHLLNVYPDGMTGKQRMDYMKKKTIEYEKLKDTWKVAVNQGLDNQGELGYTTSMVRKDVLRTDRHHPFYAGSDDNASITSLFNILTTYALNHPKVSYCQGMSDLASPLLVTMNDEAHAYICFCALMHRLNRNFMIDGIAMTAKFTHLAEALMYYDSEFYNYLKSHQADDLLFCYRWMLLEMKREFVFEDSMHMLEVLWSSLPADPPHIELKLIDVLFQPPLPPQNHTTQINNNTKTTSANQKTHHHHHHHHLRESAYSKMCNLRRRSSSLSITSNTNNTSNISVTSRTHSRQFYRQNYSLDETTSRYKNTMDLRNFKHYKSMDDVATQLSARYETASSTTPSEFTKSRPSSFYNHLNLNDEIILKNVTELCNDVYDVNNHHDNDANDGSLEKGAESSSGNETTSSLVDSHELQPLQSNHQSANNNRRVVKNLNEFLSFSKRKNCDSTISPDGPKEAYKTPVENGDFGEHWRLQTDKKVRQQKKSDDVFVWENPLHLVNFYENLSRRALRRRCQLNNDDSAPTEFLEFFMSQNRGESPKLVNSCEEVTETTVGRTFILSSSGSAAGASSSSSSSSLRLPPPDEFGGGNPFLMFLCITVLLQHRNHIIELAMDYNEIAMYFDKMVRKHNVSGVLNQARILYERYIKQHKAHYRYVSSFNKDC